MIFNFWRNKEKTEYPEEIANYFALNKSKEQTDPHFIIFDTESSSLSVSTAQLLSIGALKIRDNSISMKDIFNCFIDTGKSGVKGNVHIHEIMTSGKEERKELKEALLEFLKFIGNSVLVAHHAQHDLSLINRYLSEVFPGVRLVNKVIDTAELAIKNDKKDNPSTKIVSENYSLDALLKRYNIEAVERHTALGDAYSTALLFLKIR